MSTDVKARRDAGHQLSESQKERLWMREMISQIPDLRASLDSTFQHVAVLARLAGITPEKMVAETQDFKKNYAFLAECMKEEQRLNQERQKVPVSDETKSAIEQATIKPTKHAKKAKPSS